MSDLFRLELLGSVRVLNAEGRDTELRAKKPLALLCYLAVEGPGSRDQLAHLLWPSASRQGAGHSLRQALSTARKHFDVDPFVGSSEIGLNPAIVTTDIAELRLALSTGDNAAAHALMRGRPLSGPDAGNDRDLEAWFERTRASILGTYVEALEVEAQSALEQDDMEQIRDLVAKGSQVGLDSAVLRSTLLGKLGGLPPWSLATRGMGALESLVYQLRPGVAPALLVVRTTSPTWTEEAITKVIDGLPETGRPRLLSIPGGAGGNGHALVDFLERLLTLPGGAGIQAATMSVLAELRRDPKAFSGANARHRIEHALEDALEAVLDEVPVILSLAAEDLGLLLAGALATSLELHGGEGLGIVIHGPDGLRLRGEPVRTIASAVSSTRLIDVEPVQVAADPTSAKPDRSPPSLRGRKWLVTAAVGVAVAVLASASFADFGHATSDGVSLLPGHDVLFCSMRGGTGHYYRWVEQGGIIERFSNVPTDVCRHSLLSAERTTVYLAHQTGDTLRWLAYSTKGSMRADQTGVEVHAEPSSYPPAWGTTVVLAGMPPHAASGDTDDAAVGLSLLTISPETGNPLAKGHRYPWAVTQKTSTPMNSDLLRVNLETGVVEELIATPESEQDGWLLGESLIFSRGQIGDQEDGSLEIFRKNLETGQEEQLTRNSWNDYELAVSPAGTHVCWQSEEKGHYQADIWVMDLGTGRSWNLTDSQSRDSGCAWTPDGNALIYYSLRTGDSDIFLQSMEGGTPRNISHFPDFDAFTGFIPPSASVDPS